MTHWWRAYDEAVDDPKLQLLPPPLFKAWFNILCLTSGMGGRVPPIETVAFKLRISEVKAGAILEELVTRELLDEFEGVLRPHNWERRQFKSDVTDPTAAERMRNYRNRHRNATVTVTVPREEQKNRRTDTESERKNSSLRSEDARKRASRLPEDWAPSEIDIAFARSRGLGDEDIRTEIEKFRNYWHAKGGRDAAKLDWPATWRNWAITAGNSNGKRSHQGGNRGNGSDFLAGLAKVAASISGDGSMGGSACEKVPLGRVNIDGKRTDDG